MNEITHPRPQLNAALISVSNGDRIYKALNKPSKMWFLYPLVVNVVRKQETKQVLI